MSAWRGKRAKGRRGAQDPESERSAWLAELEREAVQADADDEEDWASTLRGRRSPTQPPAAAPPPARPPSPEPSWMPPADPAPPPPDYRLLGMEPDPPRSTGWDADPTPYDPPRSPPPAPDPDWASWRQPGGERFDDLRRSADPDPGREEFGVPRRSAGPDPGGYDQRQPAEPEPDWRTPRADPDEGAWRPAGADTPTGAWSPAEPTGREPDYPALFGELYRRSAAQQDPIWEAPPAAEPLPDPGQPDPPSAWPFEETTQSWEPSDRSFIWPADELPATSTDWDLPAAPSWLDEPASAQPPPASALSPPAPGNGVPPPREAGPPPADWAAAIPTDVPAARRAADPGAVTRAWRPDEAADVEPAVPLGTGPSPSARAAASAPAEPVDTRRTVPSQERRTRQDHERPGRTWPRVVAVISWIVLVMVVCWFYVFPWLERILPENF
jgi:hypothetical protein